MSVLGDKIARTIGRAVIKIIKEEPEMWKKIVVSAGTIVAGGTAYAAKAFSDVAIEMKEGIKVFDAKMQLEEERRQFHEKLIETQTRFLQQLLSGNQTSGIDPREVRDFRKIVHVDQEEESQAMLGVRKWLKVMVEECSKKVYQTSAKDGNPIDKNEELCILSKILDVCKDINLKQT